MKFYANFHFPARLGPITSSMGDRQSADANDAGLHYALSVASNGPDLNPINNVVWEILQDQIYKNQTNNVEELWQHVEEWDGLDQRLTDTAIRE